ncbi:hypothetical protein L1887_18281 [Cichorium endivia]|nr:hypothetical protein L1887_18281 [Cichorium endivia]
MSPSPPLSNPPPRYFGFRFREDVKLVVDDDVNGGWEMEADGENEYRVGAYVRSIENSDDFGIGAQETDR